MAREPQGNSLYLKIIAALISLSCTMIAYIGNSVITRLGSIDTKLSAHSEIIASTTTEVNNLKQDMADVKSDMRDVRDRIAAPTYNRLFGLKADEITVPNPKLRPL